MMILTGKRAAGGRAQGRPVVVHSPAQLDDVESGDILITAQTDIAYVPAMHRAAAVVTETGGRFCHAAVWARENNKPTLLQVTGVTEAVVGVASVEVDADAETIMWEVVKP